MVNVALKLPIVTSEKFCDAVLGYCTKMPYIDAVLAACDHLEVEAEMVPRLITPKLKNAIKAEAMNLNLLKRKGRKLPI